MSHLSPTFHEEKRLIASGVTIVAGVDEVGCGCLAGPVFAAAVILPLNSRLALIRNSKLLSPGQRDSLDIIIKQRATAWAIGSASVEEIDELNIRQASILATKRAILLLKVIPEYILSDAFAIKGMDIPCKPIVHGDRLVKSIAAASIIAKVARDRRMRELDNQYPDYGFAQHKGYGTKQHMDALARLGPCAIHRISFEPVGRAIRILTK